MQNFESLLVMFSGFSVQKHLHHHHHNYNCSNCGSVKQSITSPKSLLREMLGSLGSSHEEEEEEEEAEHHHHHRHQPQIPAHGLSSPPHQMRQLLINCANFISQSDFHSARQLISALSNNSSPFGDSTDRLIHQFTKALSIRLNRTTSWNFIATAGIPTTSTAADPATIQSSYLSLNQITPFIRFTHLTANQAILEAIEGKQSIHILDFNTMQGVQWPPLMQAIAENSDQNPPTIRITGTGSDLNTLTRTGERLQKFAQSLNLNFHFQPLQLHDDYSSATALLDAIQIQPQETFAVNCVLHLHKLLKDDSHDLRIFLRAIKSMNPKVVTLAEREANHNHPLFMQRFMEAVDYYSAIFDSLEATLPPNSQERLTVEQVWLGKEITDIVSEERGQRKERHERFQSWVEIMRSCGFANFPLSPFALSQAKLLLRLHYPSEGYQLQPCNGSFLLGWKNQSLFSVSSWR